MSVSFQSNPEHIVIQKSLTTKEKFVIILFAWFGYKMWRIDFEVY